MNQTSYETEFGSWYYLLLKYKDGCDSDNLERLLAFI
jgi:hypothetical protein